MNRPFHLAFPVTDLEQAREFYTHILGCGVGRSDARWIDFNFFGHQITAHLVDGMPVVHTNDVDGHAVPANHFGLILAWEDWHNLADRLQALERPFLIKPHIRFPGGVGEQATMFLLDPAGNGLEFKSFRDDSRIFAAD